ncbi:lipopolysaccharide biosynthesis protein [Terasakiella pusilla]|uniref:lipopolysaccharide biosynthesis protein n=1 Tax=Terasakiella pusilla TaxID=64973 RepID=UPI003AA9B509
MFDFMSAAFRHGLKKVFQAYFIYGLNALVPLIILPVLIPLLGVQKWGELMTIASFALYMSFLIEGACHLFATRVIAKQGQAAKKAHFIAIVLIARLILSVFLIVIFIAVWLASDLFLERENMVFWAFCWAMVLGHSSAWYFMGQQNLLVAGYVDALPKVIGLVICMIVIDDPADSYLYFAIQCVLHFVVLVISYKYIFVTHRLGALLGRIRWAYGFKVLYKNARFVFSLHLIGSLYNTTIPFLLGWTHSLESAGVYAVADRVVRTVFNASHPLRAALFPILVARFSVAGQDNRSYLRWSMGGTLFLAFALYGILFFLSPYVQQYVFKLDLDVSLELIVQLLALQMLIQTVGTTLAMQYLLPLHHDFMYFFAVLTACLFAVGMILFGLTEEYALQAAKAVLHAEMLGAAIIMFGGAYIYFSRGRKHD